MAIKIVKISELYDKDLYAAVRVNVRSGAGTNRSILRTMSPGDKIGTVSTHAEGRNEKGDKDGSIWLQLKQTYDNPSGFGAWVKYMPNSFDWKALKEQGAQTVEEQKAEQEEKDKTWVDKLQDAGKWVLIAWVATKVLSK